MLSAKKEADRIFMEKRELQAQKAREEGKTLQDIYMHEMVSMGLLFLDALYFFCIAHSDGDFDFVKAEKRARDHRTKKEEQNFVVKNTSLIVEEEHEFQKYAKHVMETAGRAGRNTYPLTKAAREGIGGGLGPIFGGLRPSYIVRDESGVQMPKYVSSTTQNIKEMNETTNIHQAKKRLGFTW